MLPFVYLYFMAHWLTLYSLTFPEDTHRAIDNGIVFLSSSQVRWHWKIVGMCEQCRAKRPALYTHVYVTRSRSRSLTVCAQSRCWKCHEITLTCPNWNVTAKLRGNKLPRLTHSGGHISIWTWFRLWRCIRMCTWLVGDRAPLPCVCSIPLLEMSWNYARMSKLKCDRQT